MAGKLIVIEGMDGAGTTTQTEKLRAHMELSGFRVLTSKEPTDSGMGKEIRRLLSMPIGHESDLLTSLALCFAADRMQHVHSTIKPGLKGQDFVLLDRYVLSSMVYQGLHLPAAFIKEINQFALKPDLTIVLDVDDKIADARLQGRQSRDFFEAPGMLAKIRARYLHYAHEDPANVVLVDGSGNVDDVHYHIVTIFEEKFS